MAAAVPDSFTLTCDCGAVLRVRTAMAGQKVRCGKCKATISVPQAGPSQAAGIAAGKGKNGPATAAADELCSICQTPIEADEPKTACGKCGLPFHVECWKENLGCSAYGCENVNVLKAGPDIRIADVGPAARAATPAATTRAPAVRPAGMDRDQHSSADCRPRRRSSLVPWIAGGCGGAALLLVIAFLLASSSTRRPAPKTVGKPEVKKRDEPTLWEDPSDDLPPAPQPKSSTKYTFSGPVYDPVTGTRISGPSSARSEAPASEKLDRPPTKPLDPDVLLVWPEAERHQARVFIDGVLRELPSYGPVSFALPPRPEPYAFRLERPGYQPIEFSRVASKEEGRTIYTVQWFSVLAGLGDWLQDLEKAKQAGRPILIFFDASDWQPACRRLLKEVFGRSEFKDRVGEDFTLVHIDCPQDPGQALSKVQNLWRNQRTAKQYGVQSYPTLLATDEEGQVIGAYEGPLQGGLDEAVKLVKVWRNASPKLQEARQRFRSPGDTQARQAAAAKLLDVLQEWDLERFDRHEIEECLATLPPEQRYRPRAASHAEYDRWSTVLMDVASAYRDEKTSAWAGRVSRAVAEFDQWRKVRRLTIPDRGAELCRLAAVALAKAHRRTEAADQCKDGLALAPSDEKIKGQLKRLLASLQPSGDVAEERSGNRAPPDMHREEPAKPAAPPVLPVPEKEAVAEAERQLRKRFADLIQEAEDLTGRTALVKKLMAEAMTEQDPATRYAMMDLARRTAISEGDPIAIISIAEVMANCFAVDALALKAEGLSRAWGNDQPRYRVAVVQLSLKLLEQAMEQKNYPAAERLVRVAIAAAKRAKDSSKTREYEEQAKQIKAALRGSK